MGHNLLLMLLLVAGPYGSLRLYRFVEQFAASDGTASTIASALAAAGTGAATWLAYLVTSALFERLRRGASWDRGDLSDAPIGIASLVAALRSATLALALPGVTVTVYVALGIVVLLATLALPSAWTPLISVGVVLVALGSSISCLLRRARVRAMSAESGRSLGDAEEAPSRVRRKLPRLDLRDPADTAVTAEGRAVARSARLPRALSSLRRWGGPFAAVAAFELWLRHAASGYEAEARAFEVGFVLAVLGARLSVSLGLARSWPLRALRLGAATLVELPAVAVNVVLKLFSLFETSRTAAGPWSDMSESFRLVRAAFVLLGYGALLLVAGALLGGATDTRLEQIGVHLHNLVAALAPGIALAALVWLGVAGAVTLALRPFGNAVERFSLIFLRVFGSARRAAFLFEYVAPRWRWLGNLMCISAPDVSNHQLTGRDGVDVLFGGVAERFERGGEATHSSVYGFWATPVGTPRVDELHCFADTWQSVLRLMMTKNALVLMDLRGFGEDNRGCEFELRTLVDAFPMRSVVFLVDGDTELEALAAVLREAWGEMRADSPNAEDQVESLRMLRIQRASPAAARAVVAELCEAAASRRDSNVYWAHRQLDHIVEVVQLIAADPAQQRAVSKGAGGPRAILTASLSCGPEIGNAGMVHEFGVIDADQLEAIHALSWAADELGADGRDLRPQVLDEDPSWRALRSQAREVLRMLGRRRVAPATIP